MNILKEALNYSKQGFSVIPVGEDKKPLIRWKKYQNEKASEKQIKEWFEKFPKANVGIVTGSISGIVVVDVEAGGDIKDLPPTVNSRTGGGGWHYYYKHPGFEVKNSTRIRELTDIRGDGGYIIAPPSLHKSGKNYKWSVSPNKTDFAKLPAWVLEKPTSKKSKSNLLSKSVSEGSRNTTAAQVAGKLLHDLPSELWESSGWLAFCDWNEKQNKPPLEENELRNVWESIKKKHLDKITTVVNDDGKKSQSTLLLEALECIDDLIFFHDELSEPFVRIPIDNHKEIWRCRSKQFKRYASKIFWDTYGKAISSEALNTAFNVLESKACFNGSQHKLTTRVASSDDAIWYDLGDLEWRVVKITPNGWEIVTDPPILFKRYSHQQAQVAPAKTGDIRKFLKFVNVSDEKQKFLLLIYIISCFIPGFAHPVINIYGPQGSAKSTLSGFIKKLIDPSATELLTLPNSSDGLIQMLSHHWFICFENVSQIHNWVSDSLCRAVTGAGFSKRELYTDDEDVIYSLKKCIGINGINLVAARPDLLERSILLELEMINKENRKLEKDILSDFQKEKAEFLGAIFTAVSRAMKIYPSISLPELPRMADFTKWGCAIAKALGHSKEEFLEAYYQNINQQNSEVIIESPIASSIVEFMKDKSDWHGTATELLEELKPVAVVLKIDVEKGNQFPKNHSALSKKLNQLKPNLKAIGLEIQNGDRENRQRMVHIQKVRGNAVSVVLAPENLKTSQESGDDNDDESGQEVLALPSTEMSFENQHVDDIDSKDGSFRNSLEGELTN
ncbi:MAG: bifunctional DNA primase/polymerase [Parcubacteria group bacterium]|jgi:hypothetical protein